MDDMEQATSNLAAQVTQHNMTLQDHTVLLHQVLFQQDDAENRNHRNNMSICGLPEVAEPKDLHAAATAIFNNLLRLTVFIKTDRIRFRAQNAKLYAPQRCYL